MDNPECQLSNKGFENNCSTMGRSFEMESPEVNADSRTRFLDLLFIDSKYVMWQCVDFYKQCSVQLNA